MVRIFQAAQVLGLLTVAFLILFVSMTVLILSADLVFPLPTQKIPPNTYVNAKLVELEVLRQEYLRATKTRDKIRLRHRVITEFPLVSRSLLSPEQRHFYCTLAGISWIDCEKEA